MLTTMASAFKKVGIRYDVVQLETALAKFLNNGGTIDEAKECLSRAEQKLLSEGHVGHANSRHKYAKTEQPKSNGERTYILD